MSSSQDAQDMNNILAALQGEGQPAPLPEEEPVKTIYIYPTDQGGLLLSPTPFEEPPQATIVDSLEQHPTTRREPPYFLCFLLMLCFFLACDGVNSTLMALFTPTVAITIIPKTQQITATSTIQLGRLLSPLSVSQSQTVPTSGRGHQDARKATGTLTFYNAAFTSQTVSAGTIFTGQDGVRVETLATITIAANNLPDDGEAQVAARAINPGASGNIPALDINGAFSNALYVKNITPFTNGQDNRAFSVVAKADIDTTVATLKTAVGRSMQGALQGQGIAKEQLYQLPCTPVVSADHRVGDEAATVRVIVSETCTVIAYDTQQLTERAAQLLTAQAKTLGADFAQYGSVHVTITKTNTQHIPSRVVLSFVCWETWGFAFNARIQQRILNLVAGKARLEARHLVSTIPGIQSVTISGIHGDEQLPLDTTHIHLLLLLTVS